MLSAKLCKCTSSIKKIYIFAFLLPLGSFFFSFTLQKVALILLNVQVQKFSILPPQRGWEFPGGWVFCKTKGFKEMCEKLYLNF